MLVDDGLGAAVEVSCPRVASQGGPQAQHRVEGRRGEVLECGEGLDKASEIGLYRLHLGLLEHDLREPDAIGRGRAFPGKIVPPFLGEPSQERWRTIGGEVLIARPRPEVFEIGLGGGPGLGPSGRREAFPPRRLPARFEGPCPPEGRSRRQGDQARRSRARPQAWGSAGEGAGLAAPLARERWLLLGQSVLPR